MVSLNESLCVQSRNYQIQSRYLNHSRGFSLLHLIFLCPICRQVVIIRSYIPNIILVVYQKVFDYMAFFPFVRVNFQCEIKQVPHKYPQEVLCILVHNFSVTMLFQITIYIHKEMHVTLNKVKRCIKVSLVFCNLIEI